MDNIMCFNMALDGSGVLILLMLLLPFFCVGRISTVNRHKRNLLFYSAMTHLFALLLRLTALISVLILSQTNAGGVANAAALLPASVSCALLVLYILCDEKGRIRFPKSSDISVGQIICTLSPPVMAGCLWIVFPRLRFMGLAWSMALQLNLYLILIDSEKHFITAEQRLGRDQALLMNVQMQPHFIFNTLSAIEALCETDTQAAMESIENLSGYLRGNIDALTTEALIPFDAELQHIRQYVALELADPARQFRFELDVDVHDFMLPALTVQPIVENAVKHGALTRRDGTGYVTLSTDEFGKYIRITVTDNGRDNSGLTDAQRERQGVGIENTRKRLAALCGGSLEYSIGETGTKAVILIQKQGD